MANIESHERLEIVVHSAQGEGERTDTSENEPDEQDVLLGRESSEHNESFETESEANIPKEDKSGKLDEIKLSSILVINWIIINHLAVDCCLYFEISF